jgi:hypothetical protein
MTAQCSNRGRKGVQRHGPLCLSQSTPKEPCGHGAGWGMRQQFLKTPEFSTESLDKGRELWVPRLRTLPHRWDWFKININWNPEGQMRAKTIGQGDWLCSEIVCFRSWLRGLLHTISTPQPHSSSLWPSASQLPEQLPLASVGLPDSDLCLTWTKMGHIWSLKRKNIATTQCNGRNCNAI